MNTISRVGGRWLANALRTSFTPSRESIIESRGFGKAPSDPEKFKQLVDGILFSRSFVPTYNGVLVIILAFFAIWNGFEIWKRRQRRWRRRETREKEQRHKKSIENVLQDEREDGGSSESSTVVGTVTPILEVDSEDGEGKPLLGSSTKRKSRGNIIQKVKSWMIHQPANIPYLEKVFPSNATSLAIVLLVGLNIFYALYRIPFRFDLFFVFSDRLGLIFVVNLPILYLFGAKNQPIRWLTGISYESLNIWHRRLGELMCLTALLHFLGMIVVWYIDLRPEGFTLLRFITTNLVLLGLGAFISYETLYFTSLGSFRQRWYELFLGLHIIFQVLALAFAFFHFPTARVYVLASLVIFLLDRLLFRITLKSTHLTATLTILPDSSTVLLSTNWALPSTTSPLTRPDITHGWSPTDHVFLSIPALSRSAALQSHPFTIFSAAPTDPHAWLSILIRARTGFSAALLSHARTNPTVRVRVDGPYGSPHALDVLESSDTAVLVVGGSGIAVAYPLLWALLAPREADEEGVSRDAVRSGPRVRLLWVVHSASHMAWLPREKIEELVRWGLDVMVTPPTEEAGRPDVAGLVRGWVGEEECGTIGVVVSGPDGMNRDVRNACAEIVGRGKDVRVCVEKFGW